MLDEPPEPDDPAEPDMPEEPCPPEAVGFEPLPREVVPVASGPEPLEPLRVVELLVSLRVPLRCWTDTPDRSRTLVPTPTDTPVPVRSRMVRRLRTVTLLGSS